MIKESIPYLIIFRNSVDLSISKLFCCFPTVAPMAIKRCNDDIFFGLIELGGAKRQMPWNGSLLCAAMCQIRESRWAGIMGTMAMCVGEGG